MPEKHTTPRSEEGADGLAPEKQAYLESQLEEGERLLWAGTTDVQRRMKRMRVLVILSLFMMFFCSGTLLLMKSPSRMSLAIFSLLFWLALPAVVLWGQRRHLHRVIYAITDRRALILSQGNPKRTESYPPEKIEFIAPEATGGGHGDLYFTMLRGKGRQHHVRYKHGFLAIAHVNEVAAVMRAAFPGVG